MQLIISVKKIKGLTVNLGKLGNKLNFMVKRCTRDGGNPLELFPVTEVAF